MEENDDRTLGQTVSDWIAHFGGSWRFIFIFGLLLMAWVGWNSLIPKEFRIDPMPFFF